MEPKRVLWGKKSKAWRYRKITVKTKVRQVTRKTLTKIIEKELKRNSDQLWISSNKKPKIDDLEYLLACLIEAGYEKEHPVKVFNPRQLYKVDYGNPLTKHIVEFDGPSHKTKTSVAKDKRRDQHLLANGWTVERIRHEI